jgi:cytochrome c-type protein NapB
MKKSLFILLSLFFVFAANADDLEVKRTLNGASILEKLSPQPEIKKWHDTEPQPRNYAQQPPVIPHTTKGYVINQKFNKCLTCHSAENSKISGATPVGKSHYHDRDGAPTMKISARRYFCVQCHVPQVDSKPFMENDFRGEE